MKFSSAIFTMPSYRQTIGGPSDSFQKFWPSPGSSPGRSSGKSPGRSPGRSSGRSPGNEKGCWPMIFRGRGIFLNSHTLRLPRNRIYPFWNPRVISPQSDTSACLNCPIGAWVRWRGESKFKPIHNRQLRHCWGFSSPNSRPATLTFMVHLARQRGFAVSPQPEEATHKISPRNTVVEMNVLKDGPPPGNRLMKELLREMWSHVYVRSLDG